MLFAGMSGGRGVWVYASVAITAPRYGPGLGTMEELRQLGPPTRSEGVGVARTQAGFAEREAILTDALFTSAVTIITPSMAV